MMSWTPYSGSQKKPRKALDASMPSAPERLRPRQNMPCAVATRDHEANREGEVLARVAVDLQQMPGFSTEGPEPPRCGRQTVVRTKLLMTHVSKRHRSSSTSFRLAYPCCKRN